MLLSFPLPYRQPPRRRIHCLRRVFDVLRATRSCGSERPFVPKGANSGQARDVIRGIIIMVAAMSARIDHRANVVGPKATVDCSSNTKQPQYRHTRTTQEGPDSIWRKRHSRTLTVGVKASGRALPEGRGARPCPPRRPGPGSTGARSRPRGRPANYAAHGRRK